MEQGAYLNPLQAARAEATRAAQDARAWKSTATEALAANKHLVQENSTLRTQIADAQAEAQALRLKAAGVEGAVSL